MEGAAEMLSISDKTRFDEFFHTDRYFHNVTNVDLLKYACECEKLFEYLQDELPDGDKTDIKKYMVFAYALGKYDR